MDFKTNINFRKQKLNQLLKTIILLENEIVTALSNDFKKSEFETVLTETSIVISELKNTIKNIDNWSKPKRVFPSLLNFPSSDFIYQEPYGKVLIISPWNYPYQLALCPLIAAVAAGNSVMLKPSELTPNTSKIISKIINEVFDENHVQIIQGDATISQQLFSQRWNYIFFTGSVAVGKIVAQAAAQFLTPVTLELGGKNPCIVDENCTVNLVAKRIVWGKFINAGQTCIAPDYLLVHKNIKEKLLKSLKNEIINAYSKNPKNSPDFPRIINEKNWNRLNDFLKNENIYFGGTTDIQDLYIAPTLVDNPKLENALMQDEIFGPILPILSYENEEELHKIISKYENPLAFYVFSNNIKWAKKIMTHYSFGGGCINDTLIYFSNKKMPFGGVGNSGIGAYHGKFSFETFSHKKPIVQKSNWLDLPLRYAPYKNKLDLIKKILKWF